MPDKPRQRITDRVVIGVENSTLFQLLPDPSYNLRTPPILSCAIPRSSSSSDATNLAVSSNFISSHHPLPAVSRHIRRASNDAYDTHDLTLTTPTQHQPAQYPLSSENRPTSATGSHRSLRRVSRQPEGALSHRRAVSLDQGTQSARPAPAHSRPRPTTQRQRAPSGIANLRPAYSEAQTDENGSTVDDPYDLLNTSYWPWRTTRVSSRTSSAILFALEDAIRRPIPFTLDWAEVNASMSEMVGVAGPAGPMGNGRVQNGAQAPVSMQVPSQPPSGVRTPTDIMRQRRDREARRKAEQDARDREQKDLEQQQVEQEQAAIVQAQARAQAHQQLSAGAPAGTGDSASRRSRVPRPRGADAQVEAPMGTAPGAASNFRATAPAAQVGGRPDYGNPQNPASSQPQLGSVPQGRPQSATAAGTGQPTGTSGFSKQAGGQTGTSQTLQQPQRVSFPHAFERWETLSSHWEGLTSYWVRKMEENKDDVEADPISKQLARQITDLSAAGANLFHAVVELQRLRASSERKFQRWFFDTRSEQERAKEVQADLERQLKAERQGHADAYAAAQTAEQDKTRAEGLLQEMRRELQISKEEARRAWEELGRREQEERERTNSLRNGEPTLVGGVQVVPMIQGLPNRQIRPPTQEEQYATAPPPVEPEYQPKSSDQTGGRTFYDEGTAMSPTGSDPFVEAGKVQTAHPSTKAPYPEEMYSHEGTATYPTAMETDAHSYVGSSEAGEEEYGYHQDHPQSSQTYGYAAPTSEASDEYEHGDDRQHYVTEGAYTSAGTSAPMHAPYPPPTADYSGSDWGVGTGWESVTPRHRHPTRLSDVLEEDEPSRTSPSRASLASRSQASRSII